METLKTINENASVSIEISDIMSSADTKKKKARRLKALRDSCDSSAAKGHIEYYIKALRQKQRETVRRIVFALFSLTYLAFTLCRVWWYHHPESNPFPETNYTVVDLIQVMYLLLIAAAVLRGVRKAVFGLMKKIEPEHKK